jgi:hypothetical protein
LGMGFSWTVCPGWPWAMVLLFSASLEARITGYEPLAPGCKSVLETVMMDGQHYGCN